ncbi:MAG: Na-translocating system protein MpsC family protein [Solirubrobacteraceae bacterium]
MADADDRSGSESTPGTTPMQPFESSAAGERHPLQEISTAMVQIYKDQFGRGPTKVRTNYAGPDALVCLLEHTFTPAERNLQAMGEHQRLRDIRMLFQYAEEARFVAPVERITGRKVRAFISGIDTNADVASELFVLEPDSEPPSPNR